MMTHKDDQKARGGCCTCRGAHWVDLGMHGVRRLVRARGACARSAFWVIIIVMSLGLLAYDTMCYVLLYLTFPTSVTYRLVASTQQNGGPSVTICNLNPMRLSVLQDEGWLLSLQELYSGTAQTKRAGDMSSREVYTKAGHNIVDMLIRCSHGLGSCSAHNFTMTLTERGLCHTFHNLGRARLDLLLNAESYDYAGLSTEQVGFLVLIYDKAELPVFSPYYIKAPPGSQTNVDIRTTRVNRLKQHCSSGSGSFNNCIANCIKEAIVRKCGCIPPWAATDNKQQVGGPICKMHSNFQCAEKEVTNITHGYTPYSECDCQQNCDHTVFTTNVYSAKLDTTDLTRYLSDHERYKIATAKMISGNIRYRSRLSSTTGNEISSLSRALEDLRYQIETLKRNIHQVQQNIFSMANQMQKRTWFHFHVGLNGLARTLKHGFIPHWDVVENQYLRPLIGTSRVMLFQFDSVLKKLDTVSISETNMRRILYLTMEETLAARMELAIQGLDNFTKVYYSFLDTKPSTTYILTPERRYDATLLPVASISDIEENLREEYGILADHLAHYMEQMLSFRNILKDVYLTNSGYNRTEYLATRRVFSHRNAELQTHLELFKGKVINKLQDLLERQSDQFKKINESFFTTTGKLSSALLEATDSLDTVSLFNYPHLVEFAQDAQLYLGNEAKLMSDLSQTGLSNAVQDSLESLMKNINSFKSMGGALSNFWQKLNDHCLQVWSAMLGNKNLEPFYAKLNTDVKNMIQNPAVASGLRDVFAHNKMLGKSETEISEIDPEDFYVLLNADFPVTSEHGKDVELRETTGQYKRLTDISLQLQDLDRGVHRAYTSLRTLLEEFREHTILDNTFVSDNLVGISLGLDTEGHDEITESIAYPLAKLLHDVGVLLAIFIGASVLSFIEFLDILFTCICCGHRQNKSRPPEDTPSQQNSPRHVTFQFPDTGNHVSSPARPALKKTKIDDHGDYYCSNDLRDRLPAFDETHIEML